MSQLHTISDADLVAELIGKDAAQMFYKGSLRNLFRNTKPNAHLYPLRIALEMMERACAEEIKFATLSSPAAVKAYLTTIDLKLEYEVFVCLFLDVKNRLIRMEEMFRGTLTHTSVYPREVVKRALELNAAAVVFGHNHPSGVSEPSSADHALTQALKQVLNLIDVKVLDHLIVGGTEVYSFAEHGTL